MTRKHHLDAYIQAEYNRQCHNGMFSQKIWRYLFFRQSRHSRLDRSQGLADANLREVKAANLTAGGAYLCLSTSNLH